MKMKAVCGVYFAVVLEDSDFFDAITFQNHKSSMIEDRI